MRSLPTFGLVLAILAFSVHGNTESPVNSLVRNRITRRTSTAAIGSNSNTNVVVINENRRIGFTIRGREIASEELDETLEVFSAYFDYYNGARCFLHSKYKDNEDERNNNQFVSPVFPNLDMDLELLPRFDGRQPTVRSLKNLSQLQLPRDQSPFAADSVFCFPPLREEGREALVFLEYEDGQSQAAGVITGDNPVRLDTGRFRRRTGFGGFFQGIGARLSDSYDYQATIRRAAIITASNRESTSCSLIDDNGQRVSEPFTWQSPLLGSDVAASQVICEEPVEQLAS